VDGPARQAIFFLWLTLVLTSDSCRCRIVCLDLVVFKNEARPLFGYIFDESPRYVDNAGDLYENVGISNFYQRFQRKLQEQLQFRHI
jgi:hypothetical protein